MKNTTKKTRPPRNAASTKLKALRVKSGLTQNEVAQRAGINAGTYRLYEQGVKNFDNARINVILSVCVILNCKVGDVLESSEYLVTLEKYNNVSRETFS